jgi:hypothetical protein
MSTQAQPTQLRRNAPCPCGSGRKFKDCHKPRHWTQEMRRQTKLDGFHEIPSPTNGKRRFIGFDKAVHGQTDLTATVTMELDLKTGQIAVIDTMFEKATQTQEAN